MCVCLCHFCVADGFHKVKLILSQIDLKSENFRDADKSDIMVACKRKHTITSYVR